MILNLWNVPNCFEERDPEVPWSRYFDAASGEYYYQNSKTGETTWDCPPRYKWDTEFKHSLSYENLSKDGRVYE